MLFGWAQGDGAYWRHLTNTIELSTCGGDAAYCQITLAIVERLLSDYHVELQQRPRLVKWFSFSVLTSGEISYYNCCLMHALVSY